MKLRLTFLWICSVHCPSAVSNTYRTSWDCPDAIETTNSAKPGPLQLYNSFRLILHEFGHVWALGKDQHDGILLHCEDKQSPWIRCFSKANIANGHLVWVGLSSSNCDFKTFRTNFEFFALLAEQNPAKSGKHLSSRQVTGKSIAVNPPQDIGPNLPGATPSKRCGLLASCWYKKRQCPYASS